MNATSPTRLYLTRKEAANYLTQAYFLITPERLAMLAHQDKGPPYSLSPADRRTLYKREDLDAWALATRPGRGTPLLPRGALASAAQHR